MMIKKKKKKKKKKKVVVVMMMVMMTGQRGRRRNFTCYFTVCGILSEGFDYIACYLPFKAQCYL